MEIDFKVGDKVSFTSYDSAYKPHHSTGIVANINPYYEWRQGQNTVLITIDGENGYQYRINYERVKKNNL